MKCAWNQLLSILPQRIRREVDILGREALQELRLRLNQEPVMVLPQKRTRLMGPVTAEELKFVFNSATGYSPWTAASVSSGYFTAPGGHRIGICGEAVVEQGVMTGMRGIHSLNIRVARDFPGISKGIPNASGSVLIIGPPGSGKTTLLRDLIRIRSKTDAVAVVDEREELFPKDAGLDYGSGIDILSRCPKPQGIEALLRNMGPTIIAVDEITAKADCDALMQVRWCGVGVLATAHAGSRQDLMSRPVYHPLVKSGVFDWLVILSADKTYHTERMIA